MAAFNFSTLKATRAAFLASVCGFVWAVSGTPSHAQATIEQPSVEVNLEALRGLEAAPAAAALPTAPVAPAPVQRIVPIENQSHVPAQAVSAPALPPVKEKKSKPLPKAKASKVENIAPAEVLAPTPAPLPVPVVIPTPAPAKVVAQPALLPPPVPAAPAPIADPVPVAQPTPVVPPSAPKPVNPNTWQNAPLPTVVPNTQLPAVSATETPPSTAQALQPRKGDMPALPAAVLPSLGASRPDTNTTSALPLPKLPESPAIGVPAAVPEKAVKKETLPVVVTPPKPKPIKKDAVQERPSDFEKALTSPAAPTISTAPMMVPVPSAPPTLPPSVTKRLEKTFAPEPEKQGTIKDVKTISNAPVAPVKAVQPEKIPEPVIAVEKAPAVPALPLPAPAAIVKPEPVAKKPELSKLPEPAKIAEPEKTIVPVIAPVVKKDMPALPPELPLPALAVMTKPEPVKPLPLPKLPEPVKAVVPVVAPVVKKDAPEKLPPAELPAALVTPPTSIALPAKADAKPVVLPKSEIANLPKIDSKSAGASAVAALPKPPSATEVAKTPVAALAKPVLPTLPKLPVANTLSMPAKPPLPALTAITGDAPPSTSDILQPKDAIAAAPLAPAIPALPALPALGAAKTPVPSLPDPAKLTDVVKNEAVPPIKVVPPLPAIAPVAASGDKASRSISYAKNKVDLSDSAKAELSDLAETLKKTQGNVRVVAYAAGTAEEASVAKKTSYARGLQIRAFLIEKGVNKLNVNVQALGNAAGGGNADRADVFLK